MKKFKQNELALTMRMSIVRDEENMALRINRFSSTMNPGEMCNAFKKMHSLIRMFEDIQFGIDRYDKKANKYLKEKYGKEWWCEVFKSFKTLHQTEKEIDEIWKKMPKKRSKA